VVRAAVKAAKGKPVAVKLPPLVSDVALLARSCQRAGASALTLINSVPAMSIDLATRKPRLKSGSGGLSGPPIKPLALRQVHLASLAASIPVMGVGGIMGAEDAMEFFLAGAKAVQVGTATLADPRAPLKILGGIRRFLENSGEDLAGFQEHAITSAGGSACPP
jgi:dihydroorotate dehydrogenase (NAD+) catalytic subunit